MRTKLIGKDRLTVSSISIWDNNHNHKPFNFITSLLSRWLRAKYLRFHSQKKERKNRILHLFLHKNFIFDWIMFNVILFGRHHYLRKCCKNFNYEQSTLYLHKFSKIDSRYSISSSNESRTNISSNRIRKITYKEKNKEAPSLGVIIKWATSRYFVVASFSILSISSRMWDEWIKIFVMRVCLCACLKVFCSGWIFLRFSFFKAFAILVNFATTPTSSRTRSETT